MFALLPDTVAIRHLRLRAGSASGPGGQEAARLRRELEWADWPEAPGESWVFIRRLASRAPRGRVAAGLVAEARRQLAGGGRDEVVRFADLAELLAALAADLVQGRAAQRWYWQRWAHLFEEPPARALGTLFTEHTEQLPAVSAHLAARKLLAPVWQSLSTEAARQLSHGLAGSFGFRPPTAADLQRGRAEGRQGRVAAALPFLRQRLVQRWRPVLQGMAAEDERIVPALLLISQEAAPIMLRQAPAHLLAALVEVFAGRGETAELGRGRQPDPAFRSGEGAAKSSPQLESAAPAAQTFGPEPHLAGEGGGEAAVPEPPPSDGTRSGADGRRRGGGPAAPRTALTGRGLPAVAAGEPLAAGEQEPAVVPLPRLRPEAPERASDFERFHTCQGGLLYLLNVLNRREVQELMAEHWQLLPAGWAWLYHLGRELGLDETDPMAGFLAAQLGLEGAADLGSLPALPCRPELLALVQRWYHRTGLWQPSLLVLEAQVRSTPAHLDLYAGLDAVRLPVRLAGLDCNPGWLPWLGRVVRFHYD